MKLHNIIKKQGMAIPLVLVFASIMAIVSTYLYKIAKQSNRQNQSNFEQLQSYFIARAGAEHVMLKIKFLHRELYDAICMYQGRNPLFDFSQITSMATPQNAIKTFNPGPIFLYKSGAFRPISGTVFTDMTNKPGHDKWLNTFKMDLTSVRANNKYGTNTFLDMDYMPKEITDLMTAKFKKAQYDLTDISLPALKVEENTRGIIKNHIIIEFRVKSSYISLKDNNFNYEIKKSIRISREDNIL